MDKKLNEIHENSIPTKINNHAVPYSWFFEVLKFREWLIFGFFTILFSRMGLPKAHTLQWVVGFFKVLNFTNDQHPQNLLNLRTSKKPTIQYTTLTVIQQSIYLIIDQPSYQFPS